MGSKYITGKEIGVIWKRRVAHDMGVRPDEIADAIACKPGRGQESRQPLERKTNLFPLLTFLYHTLKASVEY